MAEADGHAVEVSRFFVEMDAGFRVSQVASSLLGLPDTGPIDVLAAINLYMCPPLQHKPSSSPNFIFFNKWFFNKLVHCIRPSPLVMPDLLCHVVAPCAPCVDFPRSTA